MEDGLRRFQKEQLNFQQIVLILVVMEDGLWHALQLLSALVVLILVVMEDGLRLNHLPAMVITSLNPCCNGRWSQTFTEVAEW